VPADISDRCSTDRPSPCDLAPMGGRIWTGSRYKNPSSALLDRPKRLTDDCMELDEFRILF
jgi:hypothetical protein